MGPRLRNLGAVPHRFRLGRRQEIGKRTNGRYAIDVYPASQLGKETDINQGLSLGSVDMIISGSSFAAKSYPPIGVTYYPYTFRDADHLLAYTKSDVFKELAEGLRGQERPPHRGGDLLRRAPHLVEQADQGLRRHEGPQDPRARRSGLSRDAARACGANTAPIAFAEVYLALQNGTVEAQENPLTTIEAKKFYEVQKHIVLTGHIVDHLNTVVAGALWKKLSDEDRKIFTDVAQEAAAKATARDQGQRSQAGRFLQAEGPDRDRGQQGRVPRHRAQDHELRELRLPQGRLGSHPGGEITRRLSPCLAAMCRRRGTAEFPVTMPARRGRMSTVEVHKQITADEIAHTFEDEVPKGADLSQYASEDWLALAIFWIMALCVFLQFFTRYVLNDSYAWTEEIATYCLIGVVFHRLGDVRAAVAAHPGRPDLPLSAACCRRVRCRP